MKTTFKTLSFIFSISLMLLTCPLYSRAEAETIGVETFSQHYNKGIEYYKQEKYDHAENEFKVAVKIKPNDTLASYALGNTYYRLAKYDDAVIAYEKVVSINPSFEDVYYSLSLAYSKMGMTNKADRVKAISIALSVNGIEYAQNKDIQRDIDDGAFFTILDEHKKWLESKGKEGQLANLSRANLHEANLRIINLCNANLSRANLSGGDLLGADLSGANLSRADLSYTILSGVDLKDAILLGVNFNKTLYEPRSVPHKGLLGGIRGLATIRFNKEQQSGLVQLRAALKESGLRDLEREATYAIEHWKTNYAPWFKKWPKRILFEWTCGYGLNYLRPILILFGMIFVFSVPYIVSLSRQKKDGIWIEWVSNRMRKDLGKNEPYLLETLSFMNAMGNGFYFSILSAFHIGWRDLNVGSWITRIQPREYTLKATGWVRVVSGVQSLISIYLLALWVLTQFGRPFD